MYGRQKCWAWQTLQSVLIMDNAVMNIYTKVRGKYGFIRCFIKHLGFKMLPQGWYSTVDLDVEGWVDGLGTLHRRINGFTCCDSVDWCFSVHGPWPLVPTKAAKSITQIVLVPVLYQNPLDNLLRIWRGATIQNPILNVWGLTLQKTSHQGRQIYYTDSPRRRAIPESSR